MCIPPNGDCCCGNRLTAHSFPRTSLVLGRNLKYYQSTGQEMVRSFRLISRIVNRNILPEQIINSVGAAEANILKGGIPCSRGSVLYGCRVTYHWVALQRSGVRNGKSYRTGSSYKCKFAYGRPPFCGREPRNQVSPHTIRSKSLSLQKLGTERQARR